MELKAFLKEEYQLKVISCEAMAGYASANFRIKTEDGTKYVLKLHKPEKYLFERLTAEHQIFELLNNETIQKAIPNNKGKTIVQFNQNGFIYARLISYLEGEFLAEAQYTHKLIANLGNFFGEMSKKLSNFSSIAIEAYKHEWDLQNALWSKPYLSAISNGSKRKIPHHFFLQFQEKVVPEIPHLRHAVLHGDANDWNILIQNEAISGLIDFGDTCYSPIINEVAIALAYILMKKSNPLEWAYTFLHAFHAVFPLEEKELDLLYWLIPLRLSVSVCQSAWNVQQDPDNPNNEYIKISEQPAWDLLEKWITINPYLARYYFKKACGIDKKSGLNIAEETARRLEYLGGAYSLTFKEGLKMEQSVFQYMYSANGKTYLDCYNNIPHVGHGHPVVVETGQKQMAKLNTNSRYLYDVMHNYSEKLLAKFPEKLNKIFYTTSGSEATDLAIRIARTYTNKDKVLVMEHGYHGHTNMGINISDYKFSGKGGNGQAPFILKAEMPDTLRGKYAYNDEGAAEFYALKTIRKINANDGEIASFICEPIVGCGGQVCLPPEYLKLLYEAVRQQGGVCIADEVQVGFGRVGSAFWGFELHDVVPDIVCIGKPMGNGHPMGAVITTAEIAESFANGMEYFSSFGGNPVSCAIGLSVLNVIESDNLQKNAEQVGNYFKKELNTLQEKHKVIGEVRGEGLFLGVEIITDKATFDYNPQIAKRLKEGFKENGILVGTDGPKDSVIKIKPPLCFTKRNVDEFVRTMDLLLSEE